MDATRLGITFQEAQAVLRNIRNKHNEGCDTRLPRESVHEAKRGLYYCMPSVVILTKKCLTYTIEISTIFLSQNIIPSALTANHLILLFHIHS